MQPEMKVSDHSSISIPPEIENHYFIVVVCSGPNKISEGRSDKVGGRQTLDYMKCQLKLP